MTVTEVAPGIHRIESRVGPRPFAQYLLRDELTMLVDTGTAATPGDVILPALQELGLDPANLTYVLATHADVDHFGGNQAIREAAPRALFCGHALDAAQLQDRSRNLTERYGWQEAHGLGYPPETRDWLQTALGEDVPLDIVLAGGECFRFGPSLEVRVLHLPGHTPGHVGLYEPRSRTAIVTDAVLGAGLVDGEGAIIAPPPYVDAGAYEGTVKALQALEPDILLTAHYPVFRGAEVTAFLDASADYVRRARAVVAGVLRARGSVTLLELVDAADAELGPYQEMRPEFAGTLRAHLEEMEL